jgi:hypothetical protein
MTGDRKDDDGVDTPWGDDPEDDVEAEAAMRLIVFPIELGLSVGNTPILCAFSN